MPKKTKRGANNATPRTDTTRKKKLTQEDKVLAHLYKHGSITSMQAFQMYGITRLAAVIYTLRHSGYDIQMTREMSRNGSRYGRYYIRNRRIA